MKKKICLLVLGLSLALSACTEKADSESLVTALSSAEESTTTEPGTEETTVVKSPTEESSEESSSMEESTAEESTSTTETTADTTAGTPSTPESNTESTTTPSAKAKMDYSEYEKEEGFKILEDGSCEFYVDGYRMFVLTEVPSKINNYTGTGEGPGIHMTTNDSYNNQLYKDFIEDYGWNQRTFVECDGIILKAVRTYGLYNLNVLCDGCGIDGISSSRFMQAYLKVSKMENGGLEAHNATVPDDYQIPVTSYKRDSFDINDEHLLAYRSIYNQIVYEARYGKGAYTPGEAYSDGQGDGLKLSENRIAHTTLANNIVFEIYRENDYWVLRMNQNLNDSMWNCVLNIIRLVNPDSDLLYSVIYTDFYEGSEYITDWDIWCPVGNSQIYQPDNTGLGYAIYYFK